MTPMADLPFFSEYSGQSVDELLALETAYRVDSLVLAFEAAIKRKLAQRGPTSVSPEERVILVVEALEREVNNGGYDAFFFHCPQYADEVEASLLRIKCPTHAAIARRAVDAMNAYRMPSASVSDALSAGGGTLEREFGRVNDQYYDCEESIEQRLFHFIRLNRSTVRIP
jgi:hypothetical protein